MNNRRIWGNAAKLAAALALCLGMAGLTVWRLIG